MSNDERAFIVQTMTKAIRDTCEAAQREPCTKDEALAAFANMADTLDRGERLRAQGFDEAAPPAAPMQRG
jgi:hypothetical protein